MKWTKHHVDSILFRRGGGMLILISPSSSSPSPSSSSPSPSSSSFSLCQASFFPLKAVEARKQCKHYRLVQTGNLEALRRRLAMRAIQATPKPEPQLRIIGVSEEAPSLPPGQDRTATFDTHAPELQQDVIDKVQTQVKRKHQRDHCETWIASGALQAAVDCAQSRGEPSAVGILLGKACSPSKSRSITHVSSMWFPRFKQGCISGPAEVDSMWRPR